MEPPDYRDHIGYPKPYDPLRSCRVVKFGVYPQGVDPFNGYNPLPIEWYVLWERDGRALLVSKYGLEARPFHDEKGDTSWETCSLRAWLNGEFLHRAFSEQGIARIEASQVSTPGCADTQDRVFLQSATAAAKYFPDDEARQCMPTHYVLKDEGLNSYLRGKPFAWWLRNAGASGDRASGVGANGAINLEGGLACPGGRVSRVLVRPATMVRL